MCTVSHGEECTEGFIVEGRDTVTYLGNTYMPLTATR